MPKTRELVELRIDVGVTPDVSSLHGVVRVSDSDDEIVGRREFTIPLTAQLLASLTDLETRCLNRINTVVPVTRPLA